jgi:hypothetical protein
MAWSWYASMLMKKLSTFLFATLLTLSGFVASANDAIDVVEPPKTRSLFTLKADKDFVGAQVEVYNSRGELITTQSLQKRKMVIDFGDAHFGQYTIRVIKGGERQEFKYIKK